MQALFLCLEYRLFSERNTDCHGFQAMSCLRSSLKRSRKYSMTADMDVHMAMHNPFKALDSYKEDDRDFFFGREKECSLLVSKLEQNRCTLLYGKSGIGKTSLMNAGVIPAVEDKLIPVTIRTLKLIERSQVNLVEYIVQQVRKVLEEKKIVESLFPNTKNLRFNTLWEFFHGRTFFQDKKEKQVLLIFDQFEEAFASGHSSPEIRKAARQLFIELAYLAEDYPPSTLTLDDSYAAYLQNQEAETYKLLIAFREESLSDI